MDVISKSCKMFCFCLCKLHPSKRQLKFQIIKSGSSFEVRKFRKMNTVETFPWKFFWNKLNAFCNKTIMNGILVPWKYVRTFLFPRTYYRLALKKKKSVNGKFLKNIILWVFSFPHVSNHKGSLQLNGKKRKGIVWLRAVNSLDTLN